MEACKKGCTELSGCAGLDYIDVGNYIERSECRFFNPNTFTPTSGTNSRIYCTIVE